VTVVKFRFREPEVVQCSQTFRVVPGVAKKHTADVPEKSADLWQILSLKRPSYMENFGD
jgi:hypothetical protein